VNGFDEICDITETENYTNPQFCFRVVINGAMISVADPHHFSFKMEKNPDITGSGSKTLINPFYTLISLSLSLSQKTQQL
jgi:hypothetical protein